MSVIKYFFDREQRRKRAIERWESERAERIETDVQEFLKEIREATAEPGPDGNGAATFAWRHVPDHSEFTARVLTLVVSNMNDECAIGHAVKTLVEHHLNEAAERKEDNRVIRIEDSDDE